MALTVLAHEKPTLETPSLALGGIQGMARKVSYRIFYVKREYIRPLENNAQFMCTYGSRETTLEDVTPGDIPIGRIGRGHGPKGFVPHLLRITNIH